MKLSPTKIEFINVHKTIGSTILLIILARLTWRFFNIKPTNEHLPFFHRILSFVVHFLLYFLVTLIPISGMLYSWLSGFDVPILGLFNLPRLVGENKELAKQFLFFHYNLTVVLLVLFILHSAVGLYHRFIIRDKYGIWKRIIFSKKN